MNLVTRFLAARRDKLLMKLGSWLVCFSLVLGLMLPQQRAEALVTELAIGSVAALAASYLCACGLPLVTQGMDRDALVSNVQRLIQEFLDTELGGISIQDWLGNVWDLTVMAGKLLLGRPLTDEFVSFAQWVAGKYATQAGENQVYGGDTIKLANGANFSLTKISGLDNGNLFYVSSYGDEFYFSDFPIYFENFWLEIKPVSEGDDPFFWSLYFHANNSSSGVESTSMVNKPELAVSPFFLGFDIYGQFTVFSASTSSPASIYRGKAYRLFSYGISIPAVNSENLSIDRAESMSYIPEGIAAEQGIALDVGAAATMDLDLVLQGVLDDVLAGELTSTMEAAGEEVVDPPADEITDVDNLGLPALGAALTSRFPFSIPWDFFRAVQLLAAPAKAPYFEVDFMEPLADEVGGWNGSTTVILDFSEYAIIGQISRWTSTIGFCLMLAGATKRLIWTA